MPTIDLEAEHDKLVREIKTARKKLAPPPSSFDSNFWSSKASLLTMDPERIGLYASLQFQKYQEEGGSLSRRRWEKFDQRGRDFVMEKVALATQARIASSQAEKLRNGGSHLHNSSRLGFGLEQAPPKRRRDTSDTDTSDTNSDIDTSDQSMMRSSMKQTYCPDGRAATWEPVLGQWVDSLIAPAVHLFPWQSADSMDSIFGPGSRDDLFSAANGIFLHYHIKKAFDRGFLAIVPDIGVQLKNPKAPWEEEDQEDRRAALRKWETSEPREYRVVVLDKTAAVMTQAFGKPLYNIRSETLAGIDGRRLVWRNNARPKARYMWWAFLAAITQLSWKNFSVLIQQAVLESTGFWGTHGKYVRKNILLGFVEEIGHGVGSSIAESIMEHAIDDDDNTLVETEEEEAEEADQTGLVIVADSVVRYCQQARQEDGVDDDSDSEDEEEEEEEEEAYYYY